MDLCCGLCLLCRKWLFFSMLGKIDWFDWKIELGSSSLSTLSFSLTSGKINPTCWCPIGSRLAEESGNLVLASSTPVSNHISLLSSPTSNHPALQKGSVCFLLWELLPLPQLIPIKFSRIRSWPCCNNHIHFFKRSMAWKIDGYMRKMRRSDN